MSVTYKSSDTSVATVDNDGLVTPLKKGTSNIEVDVDGKKASAEANVLGYLVNGDVTTLQLFSDRFFSDITTDIVV